MPSSLSSIKQYLNYKTSHILTGLNDDAAVCAGHMSSPLYFSWIHFTVVDLNLTEERREDSWQITGVQDRELTDDRLGDWKEKVAENVWHIDEYLYTLEGISDQKVGYFSGIKAEGYLLMSYVVQRLIMSSLARV